MKEFVSSAKAAEAATPTARDISFKLDGAQYLARHPGENRLIVLGTQMTARRADNATKVRAFMEFGETVIVAPGWETMTDRLADEADPFDWDKLGEIFIDLIEEWSGTPTGSPNDSSEPPPTAGSATTDGPSPMVSTP